MTAADDQAAVRARVADVRGWVRQLDENFSAKENDSAPYSVQLADARALLSEIDCLAARLEEVERVVQAALAYRGIVEDGGGGDDPRFIVVLRELLTALDESQRAALTGKDTT